MGQKLSLVRKVAIREWFFGNYFMLYLGGETMIFLNLRIQLVQQFLNIILPLPQGQGTVVLKFSLKK